MFQALILIALLSAAATQPPTGLLTKSTYDKLTQDFQNIKKMSDGQKILREVYAINSGCHFSFSSIYSFGHDHPYLNYQFANQLTGWASGENTVGHWAQVGSSVPQYWTGVAVQGRSDYDQWVKYYKVQYSLNGKDWKDVDNGRTFRGSNDRNSIVKQNFVDPVYARAIRIYPQQWNTHMSMRFDAIFVDLNM